MTAQAPEASGIRIERLAWARPLVYLIVFAISAAILGNVIFYELKARADAANRSRYVFASLTGLGDPKPLFRFHFSRSSFATVAGAPSDDISAPLTKGSSSYLQIDTVEYAGDCTHLPAPSTIEIAVLAPAFSVAPLDNERRRVEDLAQRYCALPASASTPAHAEPWSWVILPRESGEQLIALRTVAKDAHGHELSASVVSIPQVVRDPPDVSVMIGVASGVVGIGASIFGFFDRRRAKPKPDAV